VRTGLWIRPACAWRTPPVRISGLTCDPAEQGQRTKLRKSRRSRIGRFLCSGPPYARSRTRRKTQNRRPLHLHVPLKSVSKNSRGTRSRVDRPSPCWSCGDGAAAHPAGLRSTRVPLCERPHGASHLHRPALEQATACPSSRPAQLLAPHGLGHSRELVDPLLTGRLRSMRRRRRRRSRVPARRCRRTTRLPADARPARPRSPGGRGRGRPCRQAHRPRSAPARGPGRATR
jgi:hypothetical protein